MSKVVTIPKDRNPFVVIVNGVKHSYPAGVSTEVPDEVADVIEKYVGAKPKPDPNAGINFGGVQSDWNQTDSSAADFIKNKPFGESYGDTLTIDPVTNEEEFANISLVCGMFYKASDSVPTMNDLANGIVLSVDGTSISFTANDLSEYNGALISPEYLVLFVSEGAIGVDFGDGLIFSEAGTYVVGDFLHIGGSLTIPGYKGFMGIQKLDEKYLPNSMPKITNAEAGQTIVITAIDSEGKPSGWAATNQKDVFVITYNASDSTVDRTFAEIEEAINANVPVMLKYSTFCYQLIEHIKTLVVTFSWTNIGASTKDSEGNATLWAINCNKIRISADNTVTLETNNAIVKPA